MTAFGYPDTVGDQIKRIACRILGGVVEWDKTTELVIQHKLPFLPLLAGSFSIPWPAECGPRGCKNLLLRPDCPRNADSMKAREPGKIALVVHRLGYVIPIPVALKSLSHFPNAVAFRFARNGGWHTESPCELSRKSLASC